MEELKNKDSIAYEKTLQRHISSIHINNMLGNIYFGEYLDEKPKEWTMDQLLEIF
jgi:hypothetical protein